MDQPARPGFEILTLVQPVQSQEGKNGTQFRFGAQMDKGLLNEGIFIPVHRLPAPEMLRIAQGMSPEKQTASRSENFCNQHR